MNLARMNLRNDLIECLLFCLLFFLDKIQKAYLLTK